MKIFLLFYLTGHVLAKECLLGEFLCQGSQTCLPRNRVCDGFPDCSGAEDEMICSTLTTPECLGFRCPVSGDCIPDHYMCDFYRDCPQAEDEIGCPCDAGLRCQEGYCVPPEWICDGYVDCGNGDDARNCPCNGEDDFLCANGICISEEVFVCDGNNDCLDWSDESEERCPCREHEIRCSRVPGSDAPGVCIEPETICDGIWNCPDGSDEFNCPTLIKNQSIPTRKYNSGQSSSETARKMKNSRKTSRKVEKRQGLPKTKLRMESKQRLPFPLKKSKIH